tara:strand:- start:1588 stop:3969 length:2382 start_codon:yes stop_codon:yes gene_type:complete
MSESQRLTCSICLETINESDEKVQCVRTPTGGCNNFFHKNCIVDYCKYDENNVCPMCRDSRICDEIRQRFEDDLPNWNTEVILDEIATNFMRPPPVRAQIVNMRNLERMPLNILLQIRELFEDEIEAQRRLIASTIPVTERQRQELEQRGELSIESINNRSTEIRRQLVRDLTQIIMVELTSRNLDSLPAAGWEQSTDSDNSIDSNQTRRSIISRPSTTDASWARFRSPSSGVPSRDGSESGRIPSSGVPSPNDSPYNSPYYSENERSPNSGVSSQSDSESDSNASSQPGQTITENQVDAIAAQIVNSGLRVEDAIAIARAELERRREPHMVEDAVDAAQDASELLNEEESEHEPELNVDENVDEITNLFEQINQNDAAAIADVADQTNEQSSEAFDSENVSAEGGAPKIESPEEEQQFVENLSNLDILQTTQSTDSSGNIITKREPTFLGNENLVEENESKNANMKESYPLNKKHDKWTGDDDPNHDKKIKIFHNWLKNVFRKFKPNSPGLSIFFKGKGLRLQTNGNFWSDWISAANEEDHIEEIIDKINNLSNANKKRLFVDLTIGTVLITGYTHPDNDNIDLDLEFIFENIENWMHFVRRVENSPRRLSSGSTTNNQQVFDISIGKSEREFAGEWINDDNDDIIFSLEIRNLNYSQLLSEYNSNDSESILTGRMSLIEAIHTFKLNMKRLLKIRNVRSDYIDLSKYISLGLFGGGDEEVDAANILLKIKDSKYTKKRSHKKRPDSPILLKNEREMRDGSAIAGRIKKKVGGNKKTRKRRFLLRNSQYKKY